jgi:hypothetical protein
MVRISQCEICKIDIEVEGNDPERCPEHTEIQMQNKAQQKRELNIADYFINKYGLSPVGF